MDGIPGLLFVAYQGMCGHLVDFPCGAASSLAKTPLTPCRAGRFAVITPALMTGTFADRFRFKPYLIFITLWLIVVYAPWCHWALGLELPLTALSRSELPLRVSSSHVVANRLWIHGVMSVL